MINCDSPCSALLWIHTHHKTNHPVQIDPAEWNGRVDLLDYVTDLRNLGDISISVPLDEWVRVAVTYDTDEGQYCNVCILPAPPVEELDHPVLQPWEPGPLVASLDNDFGDMKNGYQPHEKYRKMRSLAIKLEHQLMECHPSVTLTLGMQP